MTIWLRARARDCGMYELHADKAPTARDLRSIIRVLGVMAAYEEGSDIDKVIAWLDKQPDLLGLDVGKRLRKALLGGDQPEGEHCGPEVG